jgi:Cu/Ag efflux pump CusA
MLQPASSSARTSMISLSSKKLTPIQIGVLARWTIRPRLLAVPGVANVAIWGQRERQLQVQVDPQKLADKNVTLEQVISSTGNALWVSPLTFLQASTPGAGGFIDTANQRLGVQHNLPIIAPKDLANISIDETSGSPLTLGDVAEVVEDHQPLIGDAVVTDKQAGDAAFMIVVDKLPNTNTSDVTKGIEEALDELRPGLQGMRIDATVFRPATYVDKSVDNVTRWVLVAAALLVLVLFVLFFSWRAALTALVAIALSFVVAAWVLDRFGQTFNIVVLAGLVMVLAAVVHDAVATVANIGRRTQPAADGEKLSTAGMIQAAALETGRSVLWATFVFALALVPIFLMGGLSGDAFFPPLAVAGLVALLASLLVAMTVTPALAALLSSKTPLRRESPAAEWLQRGYRRILTPFARSPIPAVAIALIVLVAGVLVIPQFHASLLPTLKDTNVLVKWDAPFGTSLGEMDRITERAATELRALPGVRNVGAQVGQAVLGDQPVGADSAQMWVTVDSSADYAETVAAVKRVASAYPGMRSEVSTYSQERMREELGRTDDEVTVRVFGDDLAVLQSKANEVKALVGDIEGVDNARVESRPAEPTMEVKVDLAKAREAGIKPGDVRRAAATLLSGLRVGNLYEHQKVFDVVVWGNPETRRGLSSVQNLLINAPNGDRIRLGDVADVRVRPTVPVIEHEDISRFVDVKVNVSGRDAGAVARNVRERLAGVDFALEYHAELLGDYNSQQDSQRRLVGFAIAAAIGIFLLLQAAFGSWRLAVLVFLLMPVALAGGAIAAWIDGDVVTLATVAGLLAVLAIAARSSVTLVQRLQLLHAREGVPFGEELVAQGTRDQLAPTVMTFFATALVLVAAIVIGDGAGLEIVQPMAVVMLGGLVTSAVVSLFVLPALYLRFAPRNAPGPSLAEREMNLIEMSQPGAGNGETAAAGATTSVGVETTSAAVEDA